MKKHIPLLSLLSLIFAGCTSLPQQQTGVASMSNLIIAEPMDIGYRSELYLARLNELLARTDLPADQEAQLLYDRGVIYDRVGLRGLARFDFRRALRLKPDMPQAFNHLGIHYTQIMDFMHAYEAFDSALELDPSFEYAYLNRGIALYYGGREKLAVKDLEKFQLLQSNDPYRAIWLYLAEYRVDPMLAKQHLQQARDKMDPNAWATQLLDLYLGSLSEADFINELSVGVKNRQELVDRLCEGYFYLGKLHQLKGYQGTASNFFKLTLGTNHYGFVEHRYAKLELELQRERSFVMEGDN
jgi:lipoprotein NlpI